MEFFRAVYFLEPLDGRLMTNGGLCSGERSPLRPIKNQETVLHFSTNLPTIQRILFNFCVFFRVRKTSQDMAQNNRGTGLRENYPKFGISHLDCVARLRFGSCVQDLFSVDSLYNTSQNFDAGRRPQYRREIRWSQVLPCVIAQFGQSSPP